MFSEFLFILIKPIWLLELRFDEGRGEFFVSESGHDEVLVVLGTPVVTWPIFTFFICILSALWSVVDRTLLSAGVVLDKLS